MTRIPRFRNLNAFFTALESMTEEKVQPRPGTVRALQQQTPITNTYVQELEGPLGDTHRLFTFFGKLKPKESDAFKEMMEVNKELFSRHHFGLYAHDHEGYFMVRVHTLPRNAHRAAIQELHDHWHPETISDVIRRFRMVGGKPEAPHNQLVQDLTEQGSIRFESDAILRKRRGPHPADHSTLTGIELYTKFAEPAAAHAFIEEIRKMFGRYPALHEERVQIAQHGPHVRLGWYAPNTAENRQILNRARAE